MSTEDGRTANPSSHQVLVVSVLQIYLLSTRPKAYRVTKPAHPQRLGGPMTSENEQLTTTAPRRTGADLLVTCLGAEGVTTVAGVPGTTVMEVLDSLSRQSRIRFITVRHEQVAGFIADGISRGGAAPGVALVSRGPGAANAAIAVQNAYDESVPMVLLVGQVPGSITDRRAFEEMDVVATFRPMSKWAIEVHDVARLPELVQRAVRASVTGRPGPVVVSLPLDVLQADAPEDVLPSRKHRSYPPGPDTAAISAAIEVLTEAKRPAVVVGGGATGEGARYVQLADRLGAALSTTWMRQALVSHDADCFVGALGYGAHAVTERSVREADVLVAIGCRFSEFTSKRWTLVGPETRLIHVDIDPDELGRNYLPEVGITSDAANAVSALLEGLPTEDRDSHWRDSLRSEYLRVSSLESEELRADDPGAGVSSLTAVRVLKDLLDTSRVRVLQDAPSFAPWTHRYLHLAREGTLYASAGGAMAWGFPAAMGIALARPAERLVTVSGDGSFWMVAQDFETCVRERIPLVNIVMNNYAYGNTRDRQRSTHGGRYLGVFYGNPDFAAFAESLGGFGVRVEGDDDLPSAVESALAQDKPAIIDVIQDQMYGLPPGLTPLAAR